MTDQSSLNRGGEYVITHAQAYTYSKNVFSMKSFEIRFSISKFWSCLVHPLFLVLNTYFILHTIENRQSVRIWLIICFKPFSFFRIPNCFAIVYLCISFLYETKSKSLRSEFFAERPERELAYMNYFDWNWSWAMSVGCATNIQQY